MTKQVASLLLALGAVFPSSRVAPAARAEAAAPSPVRAAILPAAVAGSNPRVTWLSGGHDATCAVRDRAVYCWGGPFGTRDLDRSIVAPRRVPGIAGVDSVSVLSGSACARSGSRVMCWGDNRWGELGDGTTTERDQPVAVKRLKGDIEQIVAGQHHTCGIVDGGARCWGHGSYGQLGDGTKRSPVTTPVQVRGLTKGVTSMALGIFTTCAIVDGHVKCWGMNTSGELGLVPHTNRTIPVDAPPPGDDFLGVRSEGFTTCAFAIDRVICWGDHAWTSPPGLGPIFDLAIGFDGGCVLRSGAVTCFRWDSEARAAIRLPAPATQISAGTHHTCALAGGEVYCWGNRGFGALGDGTPPKQKFDPTFVRPEPAPVAWPSDAPSPIAVHVDTIATAAIRTRRRRSRARLPAGAWCHRCRDRAHLREPRSPRFDMANSRSDDTSGLPCVRFGATVGGHLRLGQRTIVVSGVPPPPTLFARRLASTAGDASRK